MKISTLIKREPFGDIFENTIMPFLHEYTGIEHKVCWNKNSVKSDQIWFCNPHINSIFIPKANKEIFSSIIGEYSSNPSSPWKNLVQKLYIYFSINKNTSKILCKYKISISPPIDTAKNKLIIGGNNKIRIIDINKSLVFVILKKGFNKKYLEKEIFVRERFPYLPIPKISNISKSKKWYSEEYIVGTPPNRLRNNIGDIALINSLKMLFRLYKETKKDTSYLTYVNRIYQELTSNLDNLNFIESKTLSDLHNIINFIISYFKKNDNDMVLAYSHGDFHPGNIICNDDNFWIMDWEHSGEKSLSYDLIIMLLGARIESGYSKRLLDIANNKVTDDKKRFISKWPYLNWNEFKIRKDYLLIFILEDLLFYLEEYNNMAFYKNPSCLNLRCKEITQFISNFK